MQDNVTQIETGADLLAKGWRHVAYCDGGEIHWVSGIAPRDCELYQRADPPEILASTAQPEVKGLVEAVERSAKMIDKAASAAAGQDFPALAEALDNIEFRLRQALAAYREAQP